MPVTSFNVILAEIMPMHSLKGKSGPFSSIPIGKIFQAF